MTEITHEHLHEILDRLTRIEGKLDSLRDQTRSSFKLEKHIMSKLTDALDFAEQTAAEDAAADNAAKGLLENLSKMIADLKEGVVDPAAIARIEALAQGVRDRAAALSAAVVANTPAAEPPVGGSTGGNTEPN